MSFREERKKEWMKKGAYGVVFQDVTRNNKLTPAAKGLYAYLASFCGDKDECFPSVDLILKEMGFSRETFYKNINALVAAGVVEKNNLTIMEGLGVQFTG